MGRNEQKKMIRELINITNELKSNLLKNGGGAEELCKDIDNLESEFKKAEIEPDNFDADNLKNDILQEMTINETEELRDRIDGLVEEIDSYLEECEDRYSQNKFDDIEDKLSKKDDLQDCVDFDDVTSIDEVMDGLDSLINNLESLL